MRRTLILSAGLALALSGCSYGADPDRRIDYVLYFHDATTALDGPAIAIVARAAAAARATPTLDVTVAGYADAPLAPESNQILSRLRAQSVADALVSRGVAHDRITIVPRRAVGADPGAESGRVEIRVGT